MFTNNKHPTCGGPVDHACTTFSKKDGLVLPTVHMCGDSSLQKRVEKANEEVKRVLGDANAKQEKPRGKCEDSPD